MLDVETLFREYDCHLHRALRRRLHTSVPEALIEDACASAWATAWTHRDRIRDENPVGWLVTVAWHEALGLLRRRRHETFTEAPAELAGARNEPELAFAARESLELLAKLGPNQRLALTLQAAGYGYREIAELTGKTYTWTNRHLTEGRARLRALAAAT